MLRGALIGSLLLLPCVGAIMLALIVGRAVRIGNVIAFVRYNAATFSDDLWLLDLERRTEFPVLLSDFNEDNPSWSPDGLHLVFDVDYSGNRDLYVLDIRDGSTRRLTYHRAPDFDPTWSPDGRWIAFVSDRDGRFNSEIHLITAEAVDDTDTVALTSQASVRYRAPSWSPDSTRLAVTAGAVGLYRDTLQIIALDGQSITDLFSTPQAADRPAWSPDGTRLAFRRRFGIYVSDINTRTLNPLSATLSITYDGFAWLPDGMLVAPLSSYGFALIDPATGMIAQVDTRLYQAPDAMP